VIVAGSTHEHVTVGAPGSRQHVGGYELGRLLGVGGMAEVFKAEYNPVRGARRTVVVKRVLPRHVNNSEFTKLFVAEAKILGLLNHPNVVQAYDFGEADGALFLVLEYVDGPSIAEALETLRELHREMPLAAAAHFAHEVCLALDYVHNLKGGDGEPLNVIHRDVTPSNILLTKAGGIKLLDFGVAKYRASQVETSQGLIKGKAAYLAPETLEAKPIDSRIDIFSLGIVLHEMLTLVGLFESDSHMLTFRKILTLPIDPPSKTRPSVPPELDAIVMKALERDPARRYQTAGEMATDLRRFVVENGLPENWNGAFVRALGDLAPGAPRAPVEGTAATANELPKPTGPDLDPDFAPDFDPPGSK
jgi:serine/threonine protein kinase